MRRKPTLPWRTRAPKLLETVTLRALTESQLRDFLTAHWDELRAPATLTTKRVIDFLVEQRFIEKTELLPDSSARDRGGRPYKTFTRYVLPGTSVYSVALSLRAGSYFTHGSAIYLLGLSLELPGTVYVNREQSPKPSPAITSQDAIHRAFANAPRVSRYVYWYGDHRIVLLNGKATGRLEITDLEQATGEFYPTTKVERTLIDSVVRPVYAGGIHHVLDVFRRARERVSVNVLLATLRKLDYAYPYHQAIGFLMQHAGYPASQYERLRALGLDYDFYLTNRMEQPAYDPSWRLYYPGGFQPLDEG